MLNNELATAFPWYDKLEKQNRYKPNCEEICDYKLIAPCNTLLPFQLRKLQTEQPIGWQILNANTHEIIEDLSPSLILIHGKRLAGYDYIYFAGLPLLAVSGLLLLKNGFYYSKMIFPSGSWYSEMFYVPEVPFNIGDIDIPYLKFEWWNSTDVDPFYFQDYGVDSRPIFRNIAYLDTEVQGSEPTVTEEGENDGNGDLVPNFFKASIPYKINAFVSDYMKIALVLMQIHDNIILTTERGIRSGSLERISTETSVEGDGGYSNVTITYDEDLAIIKHGCASPLTVENCLLGAIPTLISITPVTGGVNIRGTAYAGSWVNILASNLEAGTYINAAPNKLVTDLVAGTLFVPSSAYGTRTWFKVQSKNWSCDFGSSPAIENA